MSGNRLAGDPGPNARHDSTERAEARLPGPLADRLEKYVDEHGDNKSEVVRDALDEFLPAREGPEYVVPKDPELADAYKQLARSDGKRVLTVKKAVNILARTTHTNTPKDLIRSDVLQPLDECGLVGVKNGKLGIHELIPIEDAELSEVSTDA